MVWDIIGLLYLGINLLGMMTILFPLLIESESFLDLLWFPYFYHLLKNDLNLNITGIILAMIFSTVLFLPLIFLCFTTFSVYGLVYGLVYGFIKIFQKKE